MTKKFGAPKEPSGATKTKESKAPPMTTPGDKRAFDARPKKSDYDRRDQLTRPSHHIDAEPLDPLDPADGES